VFSNLLPDNDSFAALMKICVYTAVAHQRTSTSGSTITAIRSHVTISITKKSHKRGKNVE
jgi:hypothetical protein